jgi:hypothetical protein
MSYNKWLTIDIARNYIAQGHPFAYVVNANLNFPECYIISEFNIPFKFCSVAFNKRNRPPTLSKQDLRKNHKIKKAEVFHWLQMQQFSTIDLILKTYNCL